MAFMIFLLPLFVASTMVLCDEEYFLLTFMFLIFPTNQTWIVNLFFLQLVLLTKIGVAGLVHGTCKGTLFFKKTMFSFSFFKLLNKVYNVIGAFMKLTQQVVISMVTGCLYNQVSSILTTYILFVGRLSQLVPNFTIVNSSLISMGACVVWPTCL